MLRSPATNATRSRQVGLGDSVALSLGLLAMHTALVASGVSDAVTMLANLGMVAGALWWSLRQGLDAEDLGVARAPARRSLAVGLLLGSGIAAVVALFALTGRLPSDRAVATMTPAVLSFRLLVAIPIGTAVCEELLFRSVLLGAWDEVLRSRWQSTAIVSGFFGLWHVAAEWQRVRGPGLLAGVVATAAVSALVFCPLRRRTDSVVAPIVVHAGTNTSVLAAIWFLAR